MLASSRQHGTLLLQVCSLTLALASFASLSCLNSFGASNENMIISSEKGILGQAVLRAAQSTYQNKSKWRAAMEKSREKVRIFQQNPVMKMALVRPSLHQRHFRPFTLLLSLQLKFGTAFTERIAIHSNLFALEYTHAILQLANFNAACHVLQWIHTDLHLHRRISR